MKYIAFIFFILTLVFVCGGDIQAFEHPASRSVSGPRELRSRAFEDGSNLRIVCDEIDPQSMSSLFGKKAIEKMLSIFRYSCEIDRKDGSKTVVIWATLDPVYNGSPDTESAKCLDLNCSNSQFLTVLASGGELWLHYQDFGPLAQSGVINLIAGEWSLYSVNTPIDPRQTKVKIELNADNQWEIHIVQRNKQGGKATLYRKISGKWEFNVVSSQRDDIPGE